MIKRTIATLLVMVGLWVVAPLPARAAQSPAETFAACGAGGVAEFLSLKPWDACLKHDSRGVPTFSNINDIWLIILPLLEDAIKVAGYTAAGFIIWGGIKYIKSQGDPGQFNEARQIIFNALFGLLLAMISVAIVNFVSGAFSE